MNDKLIYHLICYNNGIAFIDDVPFVIIKNSNFNEKILFYYKCIRK